MVFSPPSNLKDLILYWWKIIDRDSIQFDELVNIIAFDLKHFPINSTKKIIRESIGRKFLVEIPEKEEVALSPAMKKEFEKWQLKGGVKLKKIRKLLAASWRKPLEIDNTVLFKVYKNEIADPPVWLEAQTIRSSAISFKDKKFGEKISGTIKDPMDKKEYSFEIDFLNRRVKHDCPLYHEVYRSKNKFCKHLARVILKLNAEDKDATLDLMASLAEYRSGFNENLGLPLLKDELVSTRKEVWNFE